MAATDFIVAIELGSSKITGIAGKKHADGSVEVLALASESEDTSDAIRKGLVYNLDKTAQRLTSIVKKLESTLKASIGQVYVGIGGQSLRSSHHTETRHMDKDTKISQELIDQLKDSNYDTSIVGQEILEVAPQEYRVGNNLSVDPVGVISDHIEGHFLNIVARKAVKQKVEECFGQAQLPIVESFISPLEQARVVLTNKEKRSGCMLVDFGAGTTTVSVYKDNILRHLAVIPLGGNNITRDICSQQIEEEDAEILKRKYGCAYTNPQAGSDEDVLYTLEGKCSIEAHLLEDIVEARVNEILDNVWNQVVLSGYGDKLLAGAVITGGGINLKNMEEAFKHRLKIEKIRMARETGLTVTGLELRKDGTQNTLLALLAAGKENCCRPEALKPEQTTIFIEGNDNEEEKKRLSEAEAAAAKEDAEKRRKEAEEDEKRRKERCEKLIRSASELKDERKYRKALSHLSDARKQNVPDFLPQIRELEKEINKLKEDNSPIKNFGNKIGDFFGKIIDEE